MARLGFCALAAKWFCDTKMSDPAFMEEALSRVREIEATLAEPHELISAGLVTTEESAKSAAETFEETKVDALIAWCLMWSEDQPLLRLIEDLKDTPLLLWCWTPGNTLPKTLTALDLMKWSGPVGAQQISGALRRSGRKFTFVLGTHTKKETLREIQDFVSAANVAKRLRHTRIGLIPYRYYAMTNTWVDEFNLASKLGVEVIYVSVNELHSSSESIREEEAKRYINDLHGIPVSAEVTSQGLLHAARVSLGLAKVIEDLHLDAVSIGDCDDELHAVLKCRPCLYLPSIFEHGVVVGMEGDLLGAVAQLILSKLSDQPTMFTEIFTYDELENQILVGHPGMQDIRLAQGRSAVTITHDYEYPNEKAGVWMAFSVGPGPVTLLSIVSANKTFRPVVAIGEALATESRLQGYPHALVRLATPLRSLFKITTTVGTTQHWALVPGDLRAKICKLADILGLECTILDGTHESSYL